MAGGRRPEKALTAQTVKNAKTPEERQALMNQHMKTMHEGMAKMKGMSGMKDMPMKDMAKHHQMMEMRMEMMQTMMEMMMQRMPAAPAPANAFPDLSRPAIAGAR